jgi:CBS domain-containing protein
VETIAAVEDVAGVPLEVHLLDVEVTMVTTAMATATETATANQRAIINFRMVPSRLVGGVTYTDIVKKIVANASKQTPRAKVSMDRPTGPKIRPRPLEEEKKMKDNMRFKAQLAKCTPANLQPCSRVFIEGRSYFPDLRPKNIFFNDYDLVFIPSSENKLIIKENYVLQWGNL